MSFIFFVNFTSIRLRLGVSYVPPTQALFALRGARGVQGLA